MCGNSKPFAFRFALYPLLFVGIASLAQAELPDGPGKAATLRLCGKCHSPEQAVSLRQSPEDWEETMAKMVKLGATGTEDDFESVLAYLSKNYGLETSSPINVNQATAVDLETLLGLGRSEAAAIVHYRSDKGRFKSIEDLRNVPGLDFKKIEAKKDRLTF
jgi:competence protein ComEA